MAVWKPNHIGDAYQKTLYDLHASSRHNQLHNQPSGGWHQVSSFVLPLAGMAPVTDTVRVGVTNGQCVAIASAHGVRVRKQT